MIFWILRFIEMIKNFDTHINLGQFVLSLIGMAGLVVGAWTKSSNDMAVLQEKMKQQEEIIKETKGKVSSIIIKQEQQDKDLNNSVNEIKDMIRDLTIIVKSLGNEPEHKSKDKR